MIFLLAQLLLTNGALSALLYSKAMPLLLEVTSLIVVDRNLLKLKTSQFRIYIAKWLSIDLWIIHLTVDSGWRYGDQSRRSSQGPEHDGLLGSGSFPRPSGFATAFSAPKVRANDQYQLNRSNEPYHPPRPYKVHISQLLCVSQSPHLQTEFKLNFYP